MTDHVVTVPAEQTGEMVFKRDSKEFRINSVAYTGVFECSCGEWFASKQDAVEHVEEGDP